MSSRVLGAWCALSLLLAVGCAQAPDQPEYVSRDEIAALPEGCGAMLAEGAQPFAVGSVHGSDQVVLETNQGRCVDTTPSLIDALRYYDQERTALELARFASTRRDFDVDADPSPHPDRNVSGVVTTGDTSTDPSPHPDITTSTGGTSADPSPHPDADPDADGGGEVIIVIWIIIEDSPSGGGSGAPTTPPQPQPRSDT